MSRYQVGVDANFNWWNIIKMGGGFLIVIAVLSFVANLLGFAGGWATKPLDIMSADNVERTYKDLYDQRRSLEASLANIKVMQGNVRAIEAANGADRARWDFNQRSAYATAEQQLNAVKLGYNSRCAEYQSKWDNQFVNLAAPTNLPRSCPLLTE